MTMTKTERRERQLAAVRLTQAGAMLRLYGPHDATADFLEEIAARIVDGREERHERDMWPDEDEALPPPTCEGQAGELFHGGLPGAGDFLPEGEPTCRGSILPGLGAGPVCTCVGRTGFVADVRAGCPVHGGAVAGTSDGGHTEGGEILAW